MIDHWCMKEVICVSITVWLRSNCICRKLHFILQTGILTSSSKEKRLYFFAAGRRSTEVLASSDLQSEAYMDSVKADLDKCLEK